MSEIIVRNSNNEISNLVVTKEGVILTKDEEMLLLIYQNKIDVIEKLKNGISFFVTINFLITNGYLLRRGNDFIVTKIGKHLLAYKFRYAIGGDL